jgi:Undecaprenyl-phosphate galactose phosphotransferase WbaP
MATITVSLATDTQLTATVEPVACLPLVSEFAIVVADLAALLVPAIFLSALFGSVTQILDFFLPIPAILTLFLLFRLYPGIGLHPVTELRRFFSVAATVVLAALSITYKNPEHGRDLVVIAAWAAGIMAAPLLRSLVRHICSRKSWWGYPVFVAADGDVTQIVTKLQNNPRLGLRPVAVFKDFTSEYGEISGFQHVCGVPLVGSLSAMEPLARAHGVRTAIIAMTGAARQSTLEFIESKATGISQLLFVGDSSGAACLESTTRDMSRMLAIEVQRNVLSPLSRVIKRSIDLALTLSAGILIAPVIGLLCILVKLDSRGPIFYGHFRVGRGRRPFKVWKFRSMVVNGDEVLEQYLRDNPAAAEEWRLTRKLKHDPRITKVGRFMRRSSLDELPQLWNVIRGEMSLVGPRPVVEAEAVKYGSSFSHYLQVSPGLTGMWQVSGRNDTSYEERVELDSYYVRNWSPWLDVYLIARTFTAVMRKEGAY